MEEHFRLLVQCVTGGIALGLVASSVSYGLTHVFKVLHIFFTP